MLFSVYCSVAKLIIIKKYYRVSESQISDFKCAETCKNRVSTVSLT